MKCKKCKADIPDELHPVYCCYCGEKLQRERKKKDEIRIPTPRKRGQKWYVDLRREGVTVIEDTEAEAKAKAIAIRAGFVKTQKKTDLTLAEAIDNYVENRRNVLSPLIEAGRKCGMPIVSEITDKEQLPLFDDVDMIQVGARNMQNFELLKALGKLDKPVLLKRGWANTVKELLTSAEYIMSGGNEQIVLCERGIRTFETATRNTLDLSAVAVIKDLSRLPVIVDPSHATGHAKFVEPMALAAAAAGADGLMIEVHDDPAQSKCDAAQAVTPAQFAVIAEKISALRKAIF